jgi:hypothetical protein
MILRRPAFIGSHVFGAVAALGFGYVALHYIYDITVPIIAYQSETVLTPEVAPGGTLRINYKFTRYRSCPATVWQYVLDSRDIVYPLAPYRVEARPLGFNSITIEVPVPAEVVPGTAKFQMVVKYDCEVLGGLVIHEHRQTRPYVEFVVP